MRCLSALVCLLALGVMPMVGCSDEETTGGTGGVGGEGGVGGAVVSDCTGVEDGTDCIGGGGIYDFFGLCVAGSCEDLTRCENDDFCREYNDCRTDTCLNNGLCDEGGAVEDGTQCAGGTCQSGVCVLESTVLPCSEQGIRNAIAAGGGPYTFDCEGPTSIVTQAEIVIDNDVILDGEGRLTVDGADTHTVLVVDRGITVELRSLAIANGGPADGDGGGIYSEGVLTLIDSDVRDCTASTGGGIASNGSLTLVGSTVSGNDAQLGGGIRNDGDFAVLRNSTVSGNTANEGGGGIANGISALTLINSTLSGNSTNAIHAVHDPEDPPVNLVMAGTLIEGDCVVGGPAAIVSNGYNIESPGDTCGFDQTGDQSGVTAAQLNLGPLTDNGGLTMTHKPGDGGFGDGSVAIDQIPEADCEVDTDQRGEPRPETGGTMCDVGALEVQP